MDRVSKKADSEPKTFCRNGTSLSPQIIVLQRSVNYFITVMIGLVITLASVAVALCSATAVWDRIEYYRILRILGSTKIFIAFTILLKNALSGFAAFWIGFSVMKKISIIYNEFLKPFYTWL
jgi:Na+-transporting NADH:ubiquinone oxidoreductase subunit NqrB